MVVNYLLVVAWIDHYAHFSIEYLKAIEPKTVEERVALRRLLT